MLHFVFDFFDLDVKQTFSFRCLDCWRSTAGTWTKPSHVSRRMPSTASSPNGQSFALRIDFLWTFYESFFVFPVEIKWNLWRFCGDSACGLTQIETWLKPDKLALQLALDRLDRWTTCSKSCGPGMAGKASQKSSRCCQSVPKSGNRNS